MKNLYSPVEIYPFLQRMRPMNSARIQKSHVSNLQKLLKQYQIEASHPFDETNPYAYTIEREQIFQKAISEYFQKETLKIAQMNLETGNSFEILALNTFLMDAIIQIAFEFTLEDLPMLRKIQIHEMDKELIHKKRVIPEKKEKMQLLEKYLNTDEDHGPPEDPQMIAYYQGIYKELEKEVDDYSEKVDSLEKQLELLRNWALDKSAILDSLIIFARGGYGRGELSFSSDRDVGYCINPHRLNPGELNILKQMIIQVEHLLNQTEIETAHQYFEIDEDLTRFTQPDTIQTIPSILESRLLIGNQELLERLKQNFFEILPYEAYVLSKLNSYRSAPQPELNLMNLKEDFGGLRSLQLPLWLAAVTFGVFPSQTAELLALLIEKRILSAEQCLQLSQALELFYELRNFVGGAKKYYLDDEAISQGCHLDGWKENVISDNVEKLYLLKKKRFKGFDDFDRYRLRHVYAVQSLSKLALKRLLERNIVRTFSNFQATVNLAKQRIFEIRATEGLPQIPLALIFHKPSALLDLFVYIGNSGYELSGALKDELAQVIRSLTPEAIENDLDAVRDRFTQIMISPNVGISVGAMFEIYDPTNPGQDIDTLIGRFIPECNQMRFLLRNLNYHHYSVCEHTLRALTSTQKELENLKAKYTELYQYLTPKHILGLRWGVLFHDVGKIDPKTKHQVSGTAMAKKALERLGYDDEELFQIVSLLVYHHMTIVQLSRASTYFDQALQQFFEVGDRDIILMILLFLTNLCDYQSVSEITANDTKQLRNFFDETYHAYLETRMSTDIKQPLHLINLYLDNKKRELEEKTRIDLLIRQSLQDDLDTALFQPLSRINPTEYERLQTVKQELHQYWKFLKMGTLDTKGVKQYTEKFIHSIDQYVSDTSVVKLTSDLDQTFNWFFTAFPNRFLLSQPPDFLAQKILEFTNFQDESIFSIITNNRGRTTGVLIYAQDYPNIITRIAYGMSLENIDIRLGKMNKVIYENGTIGYCYFFDATGLPNERAFPKAMEQTILEGSLPALKIDTPENVFYKSRLRLKILEPDGKAYDIVEENGHFVRKDRDYRVVKITTEDAPMLYYKIVEAFDQVGVPIHQALVTTTGHLVTDYFYVTEEDCQRLIDSEFEEILKIRFSNPGLRNSSEHA